MVDPKIITHPHGDRTFTSTLYYGADVRESLRGLTEKSVQCVVTSPPTGVFGTTARVRGAVVTPTVTMK